MNRVVMLYPLGSDQQLMAGTDAADPDVVWVHLDGLGGYSARIHITLAEALDVGNGLVQLVQDSVRGS